MGAAGLRINGGVRHRVALSLDGAAPPVEEVAADSPGASVAADLAAGEHGGPRQVAFAMAKKARTTLQLCFTKVDSPPLTSHGLTYHNIT